MPSLLVVDDSAVDRRLVGGLLDDDASYSVTFAANGSEAIALLQKGQFDVVVTDLQMPEMDGLELVRAIRIQFADLPVILMTGQGSEELAVKALQQGAASYVPKSQLAELLPHVVDDVVGLVRADRTYGRLLDCMQKNDFLFKLENDPALIDPLVDLVQQIVVGMRLCDPIGRVRVGVALEQALLNALFRGNLELSNEQLQQSREELMQGAAESLVDRRRRESPYAEREIIVAVEITRDRALFAVRDGGPGFDAGSLPHPGDPGVLDREGGRGLVLMRTFMDEVTFNDEGNEVTMIKRREAGEQDESQDA